MRSNFRHSLLAALVAATALAARAQTFTGDADFTKFVALGDSFAAGVRNGGLAEQHDSFPALIYGAVNGSTAGFEQPILLSPGIPTRLQLSGLFPTVIEPLPGDCTTDPIACAPNVGLPRPYDNLGLPGARVNDVLVSTTGAGGLWDLILRNPNLGNTTALQQSLGLGATFALVWIGNNDVLGAATSGDPSNLTGLTAFTDDYTTLTATLEAAGVQTIHATIPDVTAIPFVDTIPPILIDPATDDPVLDGAGMPIPLIGPDGATPLTPTSKVLLTASGPLALGCGIPFPVGLAGSGGPYPPECPTGGLPDAVVLTDDQLTTIQDRSGRFNDVIRDAASNAGAALWDAHADFARIAAGGVEIGGVNLNADYLTGGLFSYDGVHPTELGYAVIANFFIEAINARYGARIPLVDLRDFFFGSPGDVVPADVTSFVWSSEAADGVRVLTGFVEGGTGDDPVRDPVRRRFTGPIGERGAHRGAGSEAPERRGPRPRRR